MRQAVMLLTTSAALLAAPAAAAAACPATSGFKGSLRTAEFSGGGGPMGDRSLTVGDPVEGRRVRVGETYYVPKGKTASFRLHGYRSRASGGTVLIIQCDFWTNKHLYFRLLEGKVAVSGKRMPSNAQGPPPGSSIATGEATILPLPGKPNYVATRKVTDSAKTTSTSVASRRGGSNLFVKLSTLAKRGKQIPCQAGGEVTVWGNGRYRSG